MKPVMEVVSDVEDRAKDVSNHARTTVLEHATHALKLFGALRDLQITAVDSVLGRVGLRRDNGNGLGPVMWFAAGAVAGSSAALLLAPSSGKDLRARLKRMFKDKPHTEAATLTTNANGNTNGNANSGGKSVDTTDGVTAS